MQTSTNNNSDLFTAWWNTTYMQMIENGNEIVKRLQPTETTLLHDKIYAFIHTLDETIVKYYHISYQVYSPHNEFHGLSYIYIATTTNLYNMIASFTITNDKVIITPYDFKKIVSYSSLSTSTWDTISTYPHITSFLQPLQMENGFEHIQQKLLDFKALFSTETQTQILQPQ